MVRNDSDISVSQAVAGYIDTLQGKSCQPNYFWLWDRYLIDLKTSVSDWSTTSVLFYVKQLEDKGLAPSTIAYHLRLIKQGILWAEENGYEGPRSRVKWKSPKIKQKTRYLTETEIRELKDYATKDEWAVIEGLLDTGCRWSELLGLKWYDIDDDNRTIKVWASKTESERVVPLSETLYQRASFTRLMLVTLMYQHSLNSEQKDPGVD